jgi:NAD(P)H-dependent FMN reductase
MGRKVTGARRIGVIVGSTRPRRICKAIAGWVREIALPFLDEPPAAALGRYEHEHTKRWSRLVSSYDGFVFVMPQYNWGYTAVVKNALDFLYAEWRGKAAARVTYGTHGGGKAAEQLKAVLQGVGMRIIAHNPRLETPPDEPDGITRFTVADLARFAPAVRLMDAELSELASEA